ncbi:cytochrome P450, partial [Parasitella parasitica]
MPFLTGFLQVPLQSTVEMYQQIVPHLTKKHKAVAISTAVALSLIYVIQDRYFKPPKNIRHIPYQGYLDVIRSSITKESYPDRANRILLPIINSQSNNGLYVRLGRLGWEIHVANPEAAKKVFLKQDLFPKADVLQGKEATLAAKFTNGPNLVFLNGSHWKAQRMIANPAFHRAQPIQLFGRMTQDLFTKMEALDETIDISDLMQRWTLDAIGKAGFGFDFHAVKDNDSAWVKTYNIINAGLQEPFYFFFPILDQALLWLSPKRQAVHQEMKRFVDMLSEVIKKKRHDIEAGLQNNNLPENEKDVLTLFIESEQRGEGALTNEELRSNLHIFFLAGHDTTSNALSFALYYLARHSEFQQRAREEVLSILGDAPEDILPSSDQLKQLNYINQVIKETLRMNGPAAQIVPRVSQQDTDLAGSFIPKGSLVTVDLYNIHHSKKVWKDADQFNPERFAPKGESSQLAGDGMTWVPFGNGARQCIGMNFSLNEQRVLLSMMLRKFTWKLPADSIHKDQVVTQGLNLISPFDLKIQFEKRY